VNSILYQRAIYPPESFKRVAQYGLPMMVTTDDKLNEYIDNIMKQLKSKSSYILIYIIHTVYI